MAVTKTRFTIEILSNPEDIRLGMTARFVEPEDLDWCHGHAWGPIDAIRDLLNTMEEEADEATQPTLLDVVQEAVKGEA